MVNVYLYTMLVPDAHGSHKRALGPLGLEIQVVVSSHVGGAGK